MGKYATNLWRIRSLKGASHEKVGHPSQKPLALIERIVLSSSRSGDLVAEPFLGFGSTAVMAVRLGAPVYGVRQPRALGEDGSTLFRGRRARLSRT